MNTHYFIAAALTVGALIPFQLVFNAQLGTFTKSPYTAALIIFLVGAAVLGFITLFVRQPMPVLIEFIKAPPTMWLGGVIAVLYILAVVIITPKLGVGTTAVMIIAGQILMALLLDHFGAFGNPINAINWYRVVGAVFVISGVYLIRTY